MFSKMQIFDRKGDVLLIFPSTYQKLSTSDEEDEEDVSGSMAVDSDEVDVQVVSTSTAAVEPMDIDEEDEEPLHHKSPPEAGPIQMLVSSKALSASPILSALISSSTLSSSSPSPYSPLKIYLPDDNPIVFRILMNILHDHMHKVIVEYPLELTAYIAVAQLDYDWDWDTVDVEELVLWLCIYWVFRNKKVFKKVTGRLVRDLRGVLDLKVLGELPIAQAVIDEINNTRKPLLESIFTQVSTIIDSYNNYKPQCLFQDLDHDAAKACDKMVMKTFLAGCADIGIWPIPEAPYEGLSVESVLKGIEGLRVEGLCDSVGNDFGGKGHGLVKKILDACAGIHGLSGGLDIEDFGKVV